MNNIIEFKAVNLQTKNIFHCNYKQNGQLWVKNKGDFLNVFKYYSLKKESKEKCGDSNS